jgi:superfamily II DNA/RNA helicase
LRKGGGCHAVITTPGWFLDLLAKKKGISLGRIAVCVLDECDKILDMGFESQVTEILKNVRPDRQSLLLSATMGRKVERVARQWLNDPVRYES